MPKKRPLPRSLPMPIDPIEGVPGLASFPGGVYNAVITLAYVYWRGACRPLPAEDSELMALVRYAAPRWARSRDRILLALQTLLPTLQSEHARLSYARAQSNEGARKAGAMVKARFNNRSISPSSPRFSDIRSTTGPTTPTHARPYKSNKTDMTTRAAVIAAKSTGQSNARLSDAKTPPIK